MSTDLTTAPAMVRPPLQARSRAGWERILDVGLRLLEEGGYDALTVADVCRRAGVSAPSIYARVDGRSGLFLAVYERGMNAVRATEDHAFADVDGSVPTAVEATIEIFEVHRLFFRAVIRHSSSNPELLARGAQESRRFATRVADAISNVASDVGFSIARAVYAECSFRAMYGDAFWTDQAESRDRFTRRTTAVAEAIAAHSSAGSEAEHDRNP